MSAFVSYPCCFSRVPTLKGSPSTKVRTFPRTGVSAPRWRRGCLLQVRMSVAGDSESDSERESTEKRPTSGKELAARYGGAYIGTSISLSLVSFGLFYALIAVGVDVKGGIIAFGDWLAGTPLGRPKVLDNISEAGGTFALAYIAHKATSPLRFPPTLVATEFVARALKKYSNRDQAAPQAKKSTQD